MTEPASRVSGPGRIQSVTRLLAVAVLTGALGLGAGGVGAVVGAAAPAEARPTHVALIVSPTPGQVGTACVNWRSGMSGLDVLGAGANYQTGTGPYTGFVLYINGVGTSHPSTRTYWAYYRGDGGGRLSYSGEGAATTNPAAGSVEAWAYQPGSGNVPPGLTYASICHDTAPPPSRTPTTSRRPSSSRRITRPAAGPSTRRSTPVTSADGSRAAVPPDSSPAGGSRRPTSASDASSGVSTGSVPRAQPTTNAASAASSTPTRSATSTAVTSLVPAAATNNSSGGGSPTGVIVGAVAVAVLGGVATWRRHVGRRS